METSRPNAKRKRLSHACTRCRSKKVRCDELEPKCTNCVRANVTCVTFDPRTLTAARRREAQSQPAGASPSRSSYVSTGVPSNDGVATHTISQQDLATADDEAESPAVSSPLLPVLPRFLNGNSLSVLTQWLDLAFARLGMTYRLHSTYKTIRASERRLSYVGLTLGADDVLPPYVQVASTFSASVGWLFPMSEASLPTQPREQSDGGVVATIEPRSDTAGASSLSSASGHRAGSTTFGVGGYQDPMPPGNFTSSVLQLPELLQGLMHAVNSATNKSEGARVLAERCFGYAFNRLPAILEETGAYNLDSIRALLLMSLYLRWRDDVEKAWQILSLAVASVHNEGLHREHHRTAISGSQELFWSVFVLDKLLSVELERKPMLNNAECNIALPPNTNAHQGSIFRAIVDLSILQDEILERMQSSRRSEEEAHASQNPAVIRQVIQDKLRLVGGLDQKLLRFADVLPHGLKPTDYLYADSECLPGLTFLAVQYYQAVFLVSRNALLINMQVVQSEIDKSFESSPYVNRLRSGMNVCANAARSILNVLNHAEEMGVRSPVFTPYAPLMAMYALTIHIVRRQSPATAKVDLELQATAMNLIKTSISLQQTSTGESSEKASGLLHMLDKLHKFSESYILRSTQPNPLPSSASTPINTSSAMVNTDQWPPHIMATRVISPPQSPANHFPHVNGALPIGTMLDDIGGANSAPGQCVTTMPDDIDGANSAPGQGVTTMPLPDFSNDWFMDMGTDALAIDWDELAMTLGLPTEQR